MRQVPKFLQGHMHLLGSRNADAPEEEQLAAKRAAPPRDDGDSDDDDAEADRQVLRAPRLAAARSAAGALSTPRRGCCAQPPLSGRFWSHDRRYPTL